MAIKKIKMGKWVLVNAPRVAKHRDFSIDYRPLLTVSELGTIKQVYLNGQDQYDAQVKIGGRLLWVRLSDEDVTKLKASD